MTVNQYKDSLIWAAMPTLDCVRYIGEEMRFGGLTKQCLTNQVFFAKLLVDIEKSGLGTDGSLAKRLQSITRTNAELGMQAADEALGDFARINAHTVVNMWNYAYSSIQDTVSLILFRNAEMRARVFSQLKQKITPTEFDDFEWGSIAQKFLGKFLKSQPAQVAFPTAFAELDLKVDTLERGFSLIEEIRCIRNCIVHNSGRVNQYARNRVPDLPYKVGESVAMTATTTEKYLLHMCNLVSALSDAAIASKYSLPKI